MPRVYAVREDNGKRVLVAIQCDASIVSGPDIAGADWKKCGFDNGPGTTKCEQYFCPTCAQARP